jgi:ATP-dependent RNA helicase DeaD
MQDFKTLSLPQPLMQALERMQFNAPTPVQAAAIPPAMEGRDILGSAQTGTGKTGAFGVPLVARLLSQPRGMALVLTPTRELAVQVMEALEQMLAFAPQIKRALLIGGEPMPGQLNQLRARPRVVVGTPGRIIDHLERGSLMLMEASFLVLDETDRMLDMGFGIQLDKIARFLPPKRQTLMFSATLPHNIMTMANRFLNDPVRVAVEAKSVAATNITHDLVHTTVPEKFDALVNELDTRGGSIIMFVKTKRGAERMADKLASMRFSVDTIHGDLQQRRRDRVIQAFRDERFRILVATDIAARGLDIPHIEHVINYDLPQCPEDYIHRIGRTARAGAEGAAVSLLTPEDFRAWRAIHKLMHPNEPLPEGMREARGERGAGGRNGKGKRPFRKFGNRNGNGGNKPANAAPKAA